MNAVTLDSMAFDHFETAGEDYLVDIDGSGFVGSIAGGVLGASSWDSRLDYSSRCLYWC